MLRIRRYASARRFRISCGEPDVLAVVLGGHPEAQHLGAVLRDQLLRGDVVAPRLGHLAPVAVHHEAVGEDRAVRRRDRACPPPRAARSGTSRGAGRSPRGTSRPASAAPAASRARRRGCSPSRTRRRGCPSPCGSSSPPHFGQRVPGGQEIRRPSRAYHSSAPAPVAHDGRHVLDQPLLVEQQRVARRAVEGDDRHAPHALARDDPVGPVRDHVEDALLAPAGDPRRPRSGWRRAPLPQPVLVERDEPLLGGAEERRVLAAPAVRIGVAERHLGDQGADRSAGAR